MIPPPGRFKHNHRSQDRLTYCAAFSNLGVGVSSLTCCLYFYSSLSSFSTKASWSYRLCPLAPRFSRMPTGLRHPQLTKRLFISIGITILLPYVGFMSLTRVLFPGYLFLVALPRRMTPM